MDLKVKIDIDYIITKIDLQQKRFLSWIIVSFISHHCIPHHHFFTDRPAECATLVSTGVGTFAANKPVPQCASCAAGYGHFAGDNVCVSKSLTHFAK